MKYYIPVSQSLLIQGRFQRREKIQEKNRGMVRVAIPSDSGQVSTSFGKRYKILAKKSQSLLIQGRFQQFFCC